MPAGYTQVFLDNFGGAKGSPPSDQNWLYDIGSGWGNSSVDNDTNSTSNIYLDGQGDLVIQANDTNGKWTSGRIREYARRLHRPAWRPDGDDRIGIAAGRGQRHGLAGRRSGRSARRS